MQIMDRGVKSVVPLVLVLCFVMTAWARKPVEFVAHQGEEMIAPNHTLAAYESARDHGLDYLKLDIRETKDGVIILQHDDNLRAMYATNVIIREETYDNIKRHCRPRSDGDRRWRDTTICTLDEALEVAREMRPAGRTGGAWIDFKSFSPRLADRVMKRVVDCGLGLDRIIVATWSTPAIRYVREKYPTVRCVPHFHFQEDQASGECWDVRDKGVRYPSRRALAEALVARARKEGLYGYNMPNTPRTDSEMVKVLHDADLWVSIWYVNCPADGKYHYESGADAYVTFCAAASGCLPGGYSDRVAIRGVGGLGGVVAEHPAQSPEALHEVLRRGGIAAEFIEPFNGATFEERLAQLPGERMLVGVDCRATPGAAKVAAIKIAASKRLHQTYVVASREDLVAAKKVVPNVKIAADSLVGALELKAGYWRTEVAPSLEDVRMAHANGIRVIFATRGEGDVRDIMIRREVDFLLTGQMLKTLGQYWGFQKSRRFDPIEDRFCENDVSKQKKE